MSWNPALDPDCPTGDAVDAIETVIVPPARDIGGFEVLCRLRLLKCRATRYIGGFEDNYPESSLFWFATRYIGGFEGPV